MATHHKQARMVAGNTASFTTRKRRGLGTAEKKPGTRAVYEAEQPIS